MEGSVVWINMFGELWRAAVEQTREATTVERLGVEVVAEDFSDMQERLKRSSHRAGLRDVTADAEELKEEDEVNREGEECGRPRVRFEEDIEDAYEPSIAPDDVMPAPAVEVEEEEETPQLPNSHLRRYSHQTIPEPDGEAEVEVIEPPVVVEPEASQSVTSGVNQLVHPNIADEQRSVQ